MARPPTARWSELGYDHQRSVMLGSESPAHVSMAGVHRVASLIKRWILGTHHGSVQPEHLDAYLDEFVFRFNRRTSGSRGMLFYRLLQQAVVTDPVTYDDVVRHYPRRRSRRSITGWASSSLARLELSGYPLCSYSIEPSSSCQLTRGPPSRLSTSPLQRDNESGHWHVIDITLN